MSESGGSAERVRVGIAGLGRSGWNIHAHLLEPLADKYQVAACMDPRQERRQEAAERFRCRTYADYAEMLKDPEVDLIVVATPSHLHTPCSIQAMTAGKDVVCEKPMARSLADADEMIAVSRRTGRRLAVFQNRRYAADFRYVRSVIESGKLGRVVQICITNHGFGRRWDWQTLQKYGGGTLNNTGPHVIDQAVQFLHEKEPEVWCHLDRALTLGDADDHVKLILRALGEPVLDIEITAACAYAREHWLVMGTRGTLSGSAAGMRLKRLEESKQVGHVLDESPTPDRSYNRDDIAWEPEEAWSAKDDPGPGQAQFYVDLYETLRHGAPLAITPESVRIQMKIIQQCHEQCPLNAKF